MALSNFRKTLVNYDKGSLAATEVALNGSAGKSVGEGRDLVGCALCDKDTSLVIEQLAFGVVMKTTTISLVANTPQTIGPTDIFGTEVRAKATPGTANTALKVLLFARNG